MNVGDYEKQVQKATWEPTQLFLMEKEGCLRRQSQEPRWRCQEQRRTIDRAPTGLHPARRRGGPGLMCLAGSQSSPDPMPAMWLPSVSFLSGSIYYHCPISVSHCFWNMCRAYNSSHLQVLGPEEPQPRNCFTPNGINRNYRIWASEPDAVVEWDLWGSSEGGNIFCIWKAH